MRLAKKGELLTHHKDKAVLTLLKMDSVIEKDFIEVHPNMSLGDMVKVISQSHRNIFPVTDNDNTLLGIVILDDIRNIMFRPELYNRFYVRKFMTMPPAKIEIGSNMDNVMKLFDQTNAWSRRPHTIRYFSRFLLRICFSLFYPHYEPYGRYIPPDRDSMEKIHSRFAHSKLFYFSITATVRRRLWSHYQLAERQSQTTGRREFILY